MALATACTRKETPAATDAGAPPPVDAAAASSDAGAAQPTALGDGGAPDGASLASLEFFGHDPCPGCGMGGRLPKIHAAQKGGLVLGDTEPEVASWQPRFIACYEQGLMARPDMGGRVILRLTVNDKGEVKSEISESALKGVVNVCITDVGRRIRLKPGPRTVLVPLFFYHEHP
jgi:hypothetical protein